MEAKIYKRVLVLSGGGAKGAYAFGCLKAFKTEGIEFGAVSGTSVGALNALLWSANAIEEGEKLWRNVTFQSVYPVTIVNHRFIPKPVIYLIAVIFVLLNLIWNALNRIPIQPRYERIFVSLSMSILIIPAIIVYTEWILIIQRFGSYADWLFLAILFLMSLIFFRSLGKIYQALILRRQRTDIGTFINVFATWWALCIGLFIFFKYYLPSNGGFSSYQSSPIFVRCFPIAAVVILSLVAQMWNEVVTEITKRITVLSSTPLLKIIEEILQTKGLQIPTLVTVAQHIEIFDPDAPTWGKPKWSWSKRKWFPDPIREWVVEYKDINDNNLTAESKSAYCAASAALPFGIVPPVKMEGGDYVDGGVFDNTPFYPFIEDYSCEQIYVVLLEGFKNDEEAKQHSEINKERWKNIRRRLDLKEYQLLKTKQEDPKHLNKMNVPPVHIPYREPPEFPEIILFYPKKSLGNFLNGTLNFNPKYAKEAMKKGYRETLEKLHQDQRCKPP